MISCGSAAAQSKVQPSFSCPSATAGAATTCYQGAVGLTPFAQSLLLTAYNGVGFKKLQSTYNWLAPPSGVAALSGAVAVTSTGSTKGLCASATVTCAQLATYLGNFAVTQSYGMASLCTGPVTFYVGAGSTQPCTDLRNYGMSSTSTLAQQLLTSLNPTICTTTNCNAPPSGSIPIVSTPTPVCPVGTAATCNVGLVGITNGTLQTLVATKFKTLVAPYLKRATGFLPQYPDSSFQGVVSPQSTLTTVGVCGVASMTCNQLFSYIMAASQPSPGLVGPNRRPIKLTVQAVQFAGLTMAAYGCSPSTVLTIYMALPNQAACQNAINNATQMNLYGLPGSICGTSNCNSILPPPSPPARPPPAAVRLPPPAAPTAAALARSPPPPAANSFPPSLVPPPAAPPSVGSVPNYVLGALAVGGYSLATFGKVQAAQFAAGLSTLTGLPNGKISIREISASSASSRHLSSQSAATGVVVDYTLYWSPASPGNYPMSGQSGGLQGMVNALGSSGTISAVGLAAMQSAGLAACTSITVASAPSTAIASMFYPSPVLYNGFPPTPTSSAGMYGSASSASEANDGRDDVTRLLQLVIITLFAVLGPRYAAVAY